MPFGGDRCTGGDSDDIGGERGTVRVDSTVADNVVGSHITDWLGGKLVHSKERR